MMTRASYALFDTQSIGVDAPARRVFDLLSNPVTLPVWTNGFVVSARTEDNTWILQTTHGEQHWRIAAHIELFTIDFYTEPQHPGRATYARVLPAGESCVVVFTMIQWPDIDAIRFAQMKIALAAELRTIQSLAQASR